MSQKVPSSGRLWAGLRSLARHAGRPLFRMLGALLFGFASLGPGLPPPPPPAPQRIEARAEDGDDEAP